jgi:hypothetical protein
MQRTAGNRRAAEQAHKLAHDNSSLEGLTANSLIPRLS